MKRQKLTHEDHLNLAKHLRAAMDELKIVTNKVMESVPVNSRAGRLARKLHPYMSGPFSEFKSVLDDLYHEVTSEEQFRKHRHVYYDPQICRRGEEEAEQ